MRSAADWTKVHAKKKIRAVAATAIIINNKWESVAPFVVHFLNMHVGYYYYFIWIYIRIYLSFATKNETKSDAHLANFAIYRSFQQYLHMFFVAHPLVSEWICVCVLNLSSVDLLLYFISYVYLNYLFCEFKFERHFVRA